MLVKDKVAAIFGGSGAIGSAVAHAMAREGARVYLGARDRKKLERVADNIRAAGGRTETFVVDVLDERSTGERIAQLTQHSGGLDIVINATSASLSGDSLPLPAGIFAPGSLAYDMMYGKGETPFLALARAQGAAHCADGLGMLVEQAAEAFTVWRGKRPETAGVLASLRAALSAQ